MQADTRCQTDLMRVLTDVNNTFILYSLKYLHSSRTLKYLFAYTAQLLALIMTPVKKKAWCFCGSSQSFTSGECQYNVTISIHISSHRQWVTCWLTMQVSCAMKKFSIYYNSVYSVISWHYIMYCQKRYAW